MVSGGSGGAHRFSWGFPTPLGLCP
jgi:hypothetical protein